MEIKDIETSWQADVLLDTWELLGWLTGICGYLALRSRGTENGDSMSTSALDMMRNSGTEVEARVNGVVITLRGEESAGGLVPGAVISDGIMVVQGGSDGQWYAVRGSGYDELEILTELTEGGMDWVRYGRDVLDKIRVAEEAEKA